jgi:hypothetical protein
MGSDMRGFSEADLAVFDRRPPSIAGTRLFWLLRTLVAALGLLVYLWLSIVLEPEVREEEPLPAVCSVPGATWADCRAAISERDAQERVP